MRNTSNWIHRTRTEKMQRNEQLELAKNHFISGFSTTDPDSPIRKWDRLLSMRDNLEPPSRLQGQPRVKSSSRLQSLKYSYLLTYYQKEWADRKKSLGIIFRRIIYLPLTACTIRTSILFVRVYVCSYACNFPLSLHPKIYKSLDRNRPCACPYPLWDRGLLLSPNIVLHVQPQISTGRPLLVIVGLIGSPQSF